jgi:hypothetical protein
MSWVKASATLPGDDEWTGRTVANHVIDGLVRADETTLSFRARQPTLQRVSTLVVTRAPAAEADVDALTRRLRAVSAVRHASLVEVHDYGRLPDGRAFLVHAWIDGDDLAADVAKRGAYSADEVLDLVEDACDALALAHRHGVAGCALAPADIVTTAAGVLRHVRLCGLARLADATTFHNNDDGAAAARDIAGVARLAAQLLLGDSAAQDAGLAARLPPPMARTVAQALSADRPRTIEELLRQLRGALSPSTRRPSASVAMAVALRVQVRLSSAEPDQVELLRDALAVARVACVDADFDIAVEQPNAILALRCVGEDPERARSAVMHTAQRIRDELANLRQHGLYAEVGVRSGRVIARKSGERIRYLGGDVLSASGWSSSDGWRSSPPTEVGSRRPRTNVEERALMMSRSSADTH